MENVRNIKIVRPFRLSIRRPLPSADNLRLCALSEIHLLADHDRSDSDRRCSKQGTVMRSAVASTLLVTKTGSHNFTPDHISFDLRQSAHSGKLLSL